MHGYKEDIYEESNIKKGTGEEIRCSKSILEVTSECSDRTYP